jgi:transposase
MPERFTREQFRAIYRQGEEAVVAMFEMFQERIIALENEVAYLKSIIAKDSHNSSKPPSSDMHRPNSRSLRRKGKKRKGGQRGHKGNGLRQVDNPDHIVEHPLTGKCGCGRDLKDGKHLGFERRQVIDIPPVSPEVTEHRAETRECGCGQQHSAFFPSGINAPVQYGERIRAIVLYLCSYQLLPQRRTTEAISDLFGLSLSEGTLNNIVMEAHGRLSETEEAIKAAIRASPVMHGDETGMYVAGKRLWEHTQSTPRFTYYYCHPKRGREAMRERGLMNGYKGRTVHDAYRSYFDCYEDILHALCNAHHLRELVFVLEQMKQRWAGTMIDLLCRIKRRVDLAKAAGRKQLAPATLQRYRKQYKSILACGYRTNPPSKVKRREGQRGRLKQSPARNLLDRLNKYKDEALAFMYDFEVPFDNNLAERDLRMTKVKQKISGCFRSSAGADAFCRIRGYISTIRKHGLNVFDHLVKCFDRNHLNPVLLPE